MSLRDDLCAAIAERDHLASVAGCWEAAATETRTEILKAVRLHENNYGEGAMSAMSQLSDLALVNDDWGIEL